ncbi:MAG: ImmA/IrrE family metallo-endopeptidase, partial [Pseudomonadota bacterium]
ADGRLGMEGCLTLDPPVIWLEARVYADAERGGPLGRDVVLHELAHLILHAEPLRQFHADAYVPPETTTYTAGCEWQAIRLSTAFAMPPAVVEHARDARALARVSGMPFKRASYRFARYRGHADRDPRQFRLF